MLDQFSYETNNNREPTSKNPKGRNQAKSLESSWAGIF
jgi:hypothetical protein